MRVRAFDTIRFLAVCAVVLQHGVFLSAQSGVTASLVTLGASVWAVPLLFALSGRLSRLSQHGAELSHRVRRILVPYLAWSVILFAYATQGALRAGMSPFENTDWFGVLFAGHAFYTLWFLAMLIYVTVIGHALRSDRARLGVLVCALVICGAVAVIRRDAPAADTDTWIGFLTVAPLCIAAYLAGALIPRAPRCTTAAAIGGLTMLAANSFLYAVWGTGLTCARQSIIMTLATASGVLILWALPGRYAHAAASTSRLCLLLANAGRYSLGIYLIHAPVLNIVRRLTGTRESTDLLWALIISVIALGISLAASWLLARSTRLAPLVS